MYARVALFPTTSICVITGALGTVYGFDTTGSDEVPEPFAFTPRMRTVYIDPFVKPVMLNGDDVAAPADGHVFPPSIEYSYPVIGDPLVAPSVNVTSSVWSPGVSVLMRGASGGPIGAIDDVADESPAPAIFNARMIIE